SDPALPAPRACPRSRTECPSIHPRSATSSPDWHGPSFLPIHFDTPGSHRVVPGYDPEALDTVIHPGLVPRFEHEHVPELLAPFDLASLMETPDLANEPGVEEPLTIEFSFRKE